MPLPRGWVCYSAWNQAIRDNLLDGRAAGRPVYLDLDGRYLAGADTQASSTCRDPAGDARERLIRSLQGTLENKKDVFKRHRSQAQYWKKDYLDKGCLDEPPPFLALLAVLVGVAEEMVGDDKFEANDYFGRLTHRLNSTLPATYTKSVIQQSYYDHIDGKACQDGGLPSLWSLLNEWLEANDYELGMPTAYPVGGLPYVSVPVSQALIRTSDRSDLHRVFAKHFGVDRSPTVEEMVAILTVSLTCPPFSRSLINTWARDENREHIARLALAELASWDSVWEEQSGVEGEVRLAAPLLLRGRLRGGPMRSLRLSLTARCSSRLLGEYRLPPGTPALARRCIVEGFEAVRLEASLTGSALADVMPGEAIDIAEVLVRRLELVRDGARLVRELRAVNLLELDTQEQVYVEAARATAGRPLIVLASDAIAGRTEELLSAIARPGFRTSKGGNLRGVPTGWVAFLDVEVLGQVPDEYETLPDLEPLLPARRLEVSLSGGLALPGGSRRAPEWHRTRPPEVVVSSPYPDSQARVSLRQRRLGGDIALPVGTVVGMGSLVLSAEPLDPDYPVEVAVDDGDKEASVVLRLRSADKPRQLTSTATVHLLIDDSGAVRGSTRGEAGSDFVIGAGVVVEPRSNELEPPSQFPPPTPRWLETAEPVALAEEDDGEAEDSTGSVPEDPPTCVLMPGAHYWDIPSSTNAESLLGRCRYCGSYQRFRNKYRSTWASNRPVKPPATRKEVAIRAVTAVSTAVHATSPLTIEEYADWDLLLDALSAIGYGSWSTLAAVCQQVVSAESAKTVARVLSGLGHVEFELSNDRSQPLAWSIAPAAITVPQHVDPFLAGYRSDSLVRIVEETARDLGGDLIRETQPGQPKILRLVGLERDGLEIVAAKAGGIREVRVVETPASSLLNRLPQLTSFCAWLPRASWSTRFAEIFDLSSTKWQAHDGLVAEGAALRTKVQPYKYALVDDAASGGGLSLVLGEVRLIKHLAALRQDRPLMAYDSEQRQFAVPLGAELPWLFDRVAVLCSGSQPARRGSLVIYSEVPADVAAGLWARLWGDRL